MGLRRRELRLSSGVNRLGTAAGLNPGGWPTSLGAALLAWSERTTGYVFNDNSGTVPATDGQVVRYVADRRGGNYPHLMAGVGSPTWNAANKAVVYDGATRLAWSSALVLPGAFTLYAWGSRAGSSTWAPFGRTGTDQFFMVFADNNAYAAPPAASTPYTGSAGVILARWRRDSTNAVRFAATGMSETQIGGTDGTAVQIDSEGERPVAAQFTTNGNDHRGAIVASADTVTGGTDSVIRADLLLRFGVSL